MRKLLALLFAVLAAIGVSAAAMTLNEALGLFVEYDIMVPYSEEGRAQLEEMIAVFREALGVTDDLNEASERAVMAFDVAPEMQDVVNKLSQSYYTLADAFLGEEEAIVRPVYLKGKHWGLKSMRMDPEVAAVEDSKGFEAAVAVSTNVEGMYWAAANWLRASEFDIVEALFAGVAPKTEAINLRVIELYEGYTHYGAYRALGAFWSGLPTLPAGTYRKNWNRSLSYLCKVVDEPEICSACRDCLDFGEVDPSVYEYLENRMFFIEYYLMERGLWKDAHRVVLSVLEDGVGERFPLYNTIMIEKAEQFLIEIEAKL